MKKLFFILSILAMTACKKENNSTTLNCKLSRIIHKTTGYTDTTVFTYSGDDVSYVTKYSNGSTNYIYHFTKSGAQYNVNIYWDSIHKYTGVYTLNGQGLFDSTFLLNLSTSVLNDWTKNYYNANGNVIRAVSNYTSYENDVKYYYNSDGNYSYWIYDFYDYRPSPAPYRDSVVFEYYTDKLKLAERSLFEKKYGNLEKNLVKKRSTYATLSGNVLKSTYDYEYLTDAKGLVTREIWTYRTQPGNVLSRSDTTYFEYNCN